MPLSNVGCMLVGVPSCSRYLLQLHRMCPGVRATMCSAGTVTRTRYTVPARPCALHGYTHHVEKARLGVKKVWSITSWLCFRTPLCAERWIMSTSAQQTGVSSEEMLVFLYRPPAATPLSLSPTGHCQPPQWPTSVDHAHGGQCAMAWPVDVQTSCTAALATCGHCGWRHWERHGDASSARRERWRYAREVSIC